MCLCVSVVKGEEDKTITAGSLVTVTVELHREPLIDVSSFGENDVADDVEEDQDDKLPDDLAGPETATQVPHWKAASCHNG